MIDLADIAPAFSFVVNKDLVQSTATYDPQAFGDASLVMAGTPFSLRFVRDRGQVSVEVGGDATGWYLLTYVLEFVDNSVTQQLSEPPDPTALANLLQGCWDKVADLFRDQQKTSQLQAFAKQKSAALLSKIFRNNDTPC